MQLPHRLLQAQARIELADPDGIMERLCSHFTEHGRVARGHGQANIETGFGNAFLTTGNGSLLLEASADDATGLAYVKLALAEHILSFAATEQPRIRWTGDGAAGSRLPYFRQMRVEAVRSLTPHMRRITLQGEELERFTHGGLHVRLLFPAEGTAGSRWWPVMGEDGRPAWPEGVARPVARVYTIRRIDIARGLVDIDMVVHGSGSGPGSVFAETANPGDLIGMTGPSGGTIGKADRYLLAGDETALPAILRILEELPASAAVTAFIEVADAAEEQAVRTTARLDLTWLHRNGREAGTTTLLQDAVCSARWSPGDDGFAWIGCEHAAFRTLRKYLREERHMPRDNHLVVAYWRRGCEGDKARSDDN
ncbi:MAG: siderophore-interacting protein [Pseudaminobacter sp.]